MKRADIYKSAGILIRNRKLLVSRSKGKDIFVAPGGKLELGETPEIALIRELREEQGITLSEKDLTSFGIFQAVAAGHESEQLQIEMSVYIVNNYAGEIRPQSEIEENMWVDSQTATTIKLGSIFAHEIIPRLKKSGLID
jgi:mutator protein MutT